VKQGFWTVGELAKLRDMAERGVCAQAAARCLDRPYQSILKIAVKHGFRFRDPRWLTAEEEAFVVKNYHRMTVDAICEALGRSCNPIMAIRRKHNLKLKHRPWTYRADLKLRKMAKAGITLAEQSMVMGRPVECIKARRRRLNLAPKRGTPEFKANLLRSRAASALRGVGGRNRWVKARAGEPECQGWPDDLLSPERRMLTALWEARRAGREWSLLVSLGYPVQMFNIRAARTLLDRGMVERRRIGKPYEYRLAPGVIRLLPSNAVIENPADLETEHERRIRMKIAEMEAAAKAGLLDDANPVAQQWDRDSRNTKRRRKVREWQLTKGAA
jgi:hypothetical protein